MTDVQLGDDLSRISVFMYTSALIVSHIISSALIHVTDLHEHGQSNKTNWSWSKAWQMKTSLPVTDRPYDTHTTPPASALKCTPVIKLGEFAIIFFHTLPWRDLAYLQWRLPNASLSSTGVPASVSGTGFPSWTTKPNCIQTNSLQYKTERGCAEWQAGITGLPGLFYMRPVAIGEN